MHLINNITPHMPMIDYLYGYIILVSSELNRFQKGPNHLKEEDTLIQEGDPTIPKVGQQTELTPKVGSERGPMKLQTV